MNIFINYLFLNLPKGSSAQITLGHPSMDMDTDKAAYQFLSSCLNIYVPSLQEKAL